VNQRLEVDACRQAPDHCSGEVHQLVAGYPLLGGGGGAGTIGGGAWLAGGGEFGGGGPFPGVQPRVRHRDAGLLREHLDHEPLFGRWLLVTGGNQVAE